jgi:phosphotransferase system HPr (HPr) family protein
MLKKTLVVFEEDGLHTRPANKFVKLVKEGQSDVTIEKNGNVAPGKSLLKIMKLAIVQGDSISLTCEGPDEVAVMDSLTGLLQPEGTAE